MNSHRTHQNPNGHFIRVLYFFRSLLLSFYLCRFTQIYNSWMKFRCVFILLELVTSKCSANVRVKIIKQENSQPKINGTALIWAALFCSFGFGFLIFVQRGTLRGAREKEIKLTARTHSFYRVNADMNNGLCGVLRYQWMEHTLSSCSHSLPRYLNNDQQPVTTSNNNNNFCRGFFLEAFFTLKTSILH